MSTHADLHVVAHVAVSLDSATTGFAADIGTYYELARTWAEDATLTGADTILAQEAVLAATPGPGPTAGAPLLAVVDGRGRVREWEALRDSGYWSDVLALHTGSTPPRPADRSVPEAVVGAERVDLAAALDLLASRGASVVRVDSGGRLTGALLHAGLVNEVSLLVHPCLAGAAADGHRWYGPDPAPALQLRLTGSERVGDGLMWLRYAVLTVDPATHAAD